MTVPTARTIARWTLRASLGWNAALIVVNVVGRRYESAGFILIVVAFLATWLWASPKIDAHLDARLGEAIAQRTMAEIALTELQRSQRAGELRVDLSVEGHREGRAH